MVHNYTGELEPDPVPFYGNDKVQTFRSMLVDNNKLAILRRVLLGCLCLLLFLTPLTFRATIRWISYPFYEIGIGLVYCFFALILFSSRQTVPKLTGANAAVSLFILWVLFSVLTKGSWQAASPFIDLPLLMLIISQSRFSASQAKTVITGLLLTGFVVALIGIDQYVSLGEIGVSATFFAQNTFSGYLSLLVPISLCLWVSKNRYVRASGMILTTVLALGVALSSTRAGYIVTIFGMLLFAFIKDKRLIVLPFIYMVVFGVLLGEARDRFAKISALANVGSAESHLVKEDSSLASRVYLWQFAWKEFTEHPVTGIGIGNYVTELERFRKANPPKYNYPILEPHSTALKLLCEMGIPGLLLFLCVLTAWLWPAIVSVFRTGFAEADPWLVAVLAGMAAFLLHNLTNTLFIITPCVLGFWVSLGLLKSLTKSPVQNGIV